MQCKEVQVSLSMGDTLSQDGQTHLRDCPKCLEYATHVKSIDAQLAGLKVEAPLHLKSAIRVAPARNIFSGQQVLGRLVALCVIAVPLVLLVGSRLVANRRAVSEKIGEWPTYHSVRHMLYPRRSGEPLDWTDEEWVRQDVARKTVMQQGRVVTDFIIKEESGLPVKYTRGPDGSVGKAPDGNGNIYIQDGRVKREPAISASFHPFNDDLRWQVDTPENFKGIQILTGPAGLRQPDGSVKTVTCETVTNATGNSKVTAYRDRITGKILLVDQQIFVRALRDGVKAKRMEAEFEQSFDYSPIPARMFDTKTLSRAVFQRTPGKVSPAPSDPNGSQ